MKATTRVGLVPILVGLMVLLSFPGLTGADGGGANVIRGEDCTISLAELGGGEVTTTDTQSVETPSGNVSLVCRADLPYNLDPPRRAVRTSGELCETRLGPTTDTEKVITPAGRVRLTCRVNGMPPAAGIGWAVGSVGFHGVDGYGVIIHTTDGGQTWVRQGTVGEIPDVGLVGVAAIDAQNAWVVGDQGTILRTRNGGRTWQLQEVPDEFSDAALHAVYAVDRKTAWVAGGLVILHTTDGGQTWIQQGQDLALKAELTGVYASDAEHAWVVGDREGDNKYGTIVRTSDGGITWERRPYTPDDPFDYGLLSVHGSGASTLWAVGHGQAVHSTDGGSTWVDKHPGPGIADHNGVFAVDHNTVWVVTDFGGIYRSDHGGADWEKQSPPQCAGAHWILQISAIDGQTAWATTMAVVPPDTGHVLHTADGGQTWIAQTTPVTPTGFWGVSFVR